MKITKKFMFRISASFIVKLIYYDINSESCFNYYINVIHIGAYVPTYQITQGDHETLNN